MSKRQDNEIEIKIPLLIPAIIIVIFWAIVMQIYVMNTNEEVEAATNVQVIEEEEKESIEIQQEEATIATYTDSDGKQYDVIATLDIPSLGIKYPILSTTSEALLKVALNKYWGANPNEVGNMCVLGHNYKNNKFFGKLHTIEIGAIVKITDLTGKTLDYEVYDKYIIHPDDNACTSQLTNGKTEITLITCYYEPGRTHSTKRYVVKARASQ